MSMLEEDKLNECKLIFDMFDEDKDSQITVNELGDCLRICGAAPSQQELDMIIKNLEDNKNEYIPFDIFIKLLERLLSTQDSEEDLINEIKNKNNSRRNIKYNSNQSYNSDNTNLSIYTPMQQYLYKNPLHAENSSELINIGGFEYKIMFMCRVNASKINQPENFKDCWILSPNSDEIRPYKI